MSPMYLARVLIVHDEPGVRATLADALRTVGYDVIESKSARDAITVMGYRPATAIVLNIAMPEADGLQALRALSLLYPSVPIILLTGNIDADAVRSVLRIRAVAYIARPYEIERLRAVVAAAIAHQAGQGLGWPGADP
jgi:DNA-binding NtrC family response regulator